MYTLQGIKNNLF